MITPSFVSCSRGAPAASRKSRALATDPPAASGKSRGAVWLRPRRFTCARGQRRENRCNRPLVVPGAPATVATVSLSVAALETAHADVVVLVETDVALPVAQVLLGCTPVAAARPPDRPW